MRNINFLLFTGFISFVFQTQVVFSQGVNNPLTIDAGKTGHTMKGGIGSSWHSLIYDLPLENDKYKYPADTKTPRGSAFGGNPPLSDTAAWNQVYKHALWLGLDFIRVELDQRMYEPDRNVFDWGNDEMKALFRILDWCQANNADVFLQQMWGHVAWNAFPGVHPLISAPRSIEDFSNGIATLLDYLIRVKRYTCIKYFCITNEPPGGTWGYWWSQGSVSGPVTPAWKAVRERLDKMNLPVPLSGPDWTSMPPFDASKIDFDAYIGAYDIHSYDGINKESEKIVAAWSNWAHDHNKPFFISEIGNMSLGWGDSNNGPKSFASSLSNASDIIKGLNLGVDAFNRWSFVNRGDLDGQWQLIRTYDIENKKYLSKIVPENEAYFGYAMITRFLGKYASVISLENQKLPDGIEVAALKNTDGAMTIIILNHKNEPVNLQLNLKNTSGKNILFKYQVTKSLLSDTNFRLESSGKFTKNDFTINLLPESITVCTSYNLKHTDNGLIFCSQASK